MFRLIRICGGRINVGESKKLPTTSAESYVWGEALTLVDGALTKCPPTTLPAFMAGENKLASDEGTLCVYPVQPNMEFECPVNASPAQLKVGDKVTLSQDGMGVTATTVGGVATICDLRGTNAAGDLAVVKFA